jgi:MGT family glycosyltransferase
MGKALFFNIPATGHINPSLNLVRELLRRGEEVVYVDTEDTRALIEASGAMFVPYPRTAEVEGNFERIKHGHMSDHALALHEIMLACLPFCLDLIEEVKPDYVIHDSMAAWGRQAAQAKGLKSIGSVTTFVLTPEVHAPIGLGSMVDTAVKTVPTLPAYLKVKQEIKQRFGFDAGGPYSSMTCMSEQNIVYTVRELQPNSAELGESYHFIGASIGKRSDGGDFPFEKLSGKPLVYISLGTINHDNVTFYHQCFQALGELPVQVVLAAGRKTDLSTLSDAPENFLIRASVPQLQILEKCDLFVTHAGMNSVHESLWYGVPMVAIPQQMEQAIVARQVEKTGAGLALATDVPIGRVTTAKLRAAVETVLARREEFRAASQKLGDVLRSAGGPARGADVILDYVRSGDCFPPS